MVLVAAPMELVERDLMSPEAAGRLARTLQVLGNDTRLRLLHALAREGELSVGDLADTIGMKAQATSNQLQRLVDRGIVACRRDGTRVIYRLEDPCTAQILALALCLTEGAQ